jgi:hypothetical protein
MKKVGSKGQLFLFRGFTFHNTIHMMFLMMYYTTGKPNKVPLALLDEALIFASEYLNIDPSLEIDFEEEFDGKCGFCDLDGKDIIISINPKMSVKEIIVTLFHELVHAKQYLKGELVNKDDGSPFKWKGKIFHEHFTIPYVDLPWEKEAYDLEEKMKDIFYTRSRKRK